MKIKELAIQIITESTSEEKIRTAFNNIIAFMRKDIKRLQLSDDEVFLLHQDLREFFNG